MVQNPVPPSPPLCIKEDGWSPDSTGAIFFSFSLSLFMSRRFRTPRALKFFFVLLLAALLEKRTRNRFAKSRLAPLLLSPPPTIPDQCGPPLPLLLSNAARSETDGSLLVFQPPSLPFPSIVRVRSHGFNSFPFCGRGASAQASRVTGGHLLFLSPLDQAGTALYSLR